MYSSYAKLWILHYNSKGFRPYTIANLLRKNDGILASRRGIAKFLKVYEQTQSIVKRPGSGWLSKITATVKELVDQKMELDDESTATQLHRMLLDNGIDISLRTILWCRTALGWTICGNAYCQLIRDANKQKRLEWAHQYPDDDFENVLWTDECTLQLENHSRFCSRKQGQRPKPKPKPKHPIKVHVWAGISKKGKNKICSFEGIMERFLFTDILDSALIPSINHLFPDESHHLMMDNDPKHTLHVVWMCAHELVGWPDSLAALTGRGLAFWPHNLKLVSAHVLGKCLLDCFLQLQQLSFRQSWLVTWTIAGAFSYHIDPEISFPCKLACKFTGRRILPRQLDVLLNNHIHWLQVLLFDFWARKPRTLCLAGFSISVCESS